jgi:hypothetical protein
VPSAICQSFERQDGDFEPVFLQPLDRGKQPVEIDRLLHIGIGAERIAAFDIALVVGGGEDHHRDLAPARVRLDRLQRLAPIEARHVEIEQDQPRFRHHLAEHVQRFLAGGRPADRVLEIGALEGAHRRFEVVLAVFDDQDRLRSRCGILPLAFFPV